MSFHVPADGPEQLMYTDWNGIDRHYGWRVREVGGVYVDVIEMGFNYRVTLTDIESWDLLGGMSHYDYGWCFPRSAGLGRIIMWVEDWELDPDHPQAPPGEWIKEVHTQRRREPGIGQEGAGDE